MGGTSRTFIYAAIETERRAQDEEYGGPEHDDEHTRQEWAGFIQAHLAKGLESPDKYRNQMIRVAALAIAAIEVHDRQSNR